MIAMSYVTQMNGQSERNGRKTNTHTLTNTRTHTHSRSKANGTYIYTQIHTHTKKLSIREPIIDVINILGCCR